MAGGEGYKQAALRISALAQIGDDWDGYGSPAPSPETLEAASSALRRCMTSPAPAPSVSATPAGGVQAEWHLGGWDIEIEVEPGGGTIEAWGENAATGESFHGPLSETRAEIRHRLTQIAH